MSAPAAAAAKKAVKFTTNFRLAGMNYLDALTVQTTALRNVRGAGGAGRWLGWGNSLGFVCPPQMGRGVAAAGWEGGAATRARGSTRRLGIAALLCPAE